MESWKTRVQETDATHDVDVGSSDDSDPPHDGEEDTFLRSGESVMHDCRQEQRHSRRPVIDGTFPEIPSHTPRKLVASSPTHARIP